VGGSAGVVQLQIEGLYLARFFCLRHKLPASTGQLLGKPADSVLGLALLLQLVSGFCGRAGFTLAGRWIIGLQETAGATAYNETEPSRLMRKM